MSLRDAWESHAANWVRWARTPGHDSFQRFHGERFFAILPPPSPRGLTLDIGAGEGRVGRALRTRGYNVVDIEQSATMARAGAGLTPGAVVRADATRLPLPTAIADLAIAFMVLHDIEDMNAAVREVARVLRPGGHFAVAIVHPMNSGGKFEPAPPGVPEVERRFVMTEPYLTDRYYADDIERDGLVMRFESIHRPLDSYTRALEDAGFAIEVMREVGEDEGKWSRLPLFLDLRAAKR
jgi:SAM-dependent methyltransferase